MNNLGIYYGATILNETDLLEANIKSKIELEYYGTQEIKNKQTYYGISIVKKEHYIDKIRFEKNAVDRVSTNESVVSKIIETLKKFKVTPIALNDVLDDLLKLPEYQNKELIEDNAS